MQAVLTPQDARFPGRERPVRGPGSRQFWKSPAKLFHLFLLTYSFEI